MSAWLRAHGLACRRALEGVRANPVPAFFSVLALATAIALPLGAWTILTSLQAVAAGFDTDPQISLALAPGLAPAARESLQRAVRQRPGVRDVRTVSKEQALAELQATEGVRDLLAGLTTNPLPDMLLVRVGDAKRLAELQAALGKLPGVAAVQADAAWVERLEALIAAGRVLAAVLAGLLAVAVLAVTFNTVRLQIAARADELSVAALVGATAAWQRRPFLYFGVVQGLLAGGVAAILVSLALAAARHELGTLAASANISLTLTAAGALGATLTSALLGWAGAWLALRSGAVGEI